MTSARLHIVLFMALFVMAFPALAADIDQEGADDLKVVFQQWLEKQKTLGELGGAAQYDYEGDITVEPADDYYAVTLPKLAIVYADDSRLDIGMISINASPHDSADQWKMTVAVPTPIIMIDGNQTQTMRLDIGAQRAGGIWDESLQNFSKLDAQYEDIIVSGADEGLQVNIPAAQIRYDLDKDGNDLWSGPGFFALQNFELNVPDDVNFKLGELELAFEMDRYNPEAAENYQKKIQELIKRAEELKENPAGNGAPPPEIASIWELLLQMFSGIKTEYRLSDLKVTKTEDGRQTDTIALGQAHLGFNISGLADNSAGLRIRLGYGNAQHMIEGPEKEIVPTFVNFDAAIENVPVDQLSEVVKNTLKGAANSADMKQMAMLTLMMKVPALLSQAGTYVTVDDNFVANDDYKFSLNGRARADIAAANSVVVDVTALFKGLDILIPKVRGLLSNPEVENVESLARLLSSLEQIKQVGIPAGGDNGSSTYQIKFEMNPEGQMLINGQDAQTVLHGSGPETDEAPQAD